jgi:hypothetical protein
MPKTDGAVAHAVLNVLVAINVPDVTTEATGDEGRCGLRVLVITFGVRVTSPGD